MKSDSGDRNPELAREILTVSLLNRVVAGLLSRNFPLLRVRGELANFTRAASGHWYFTLKDEAAQVRCAMFRGRNLLVGFLPREGDEVEVLAQAGLYEARGEFQLTVDALQRSGLGQLYERFLRLKQRLEAERLFDDAAKRKLPTFPGVIGVVTSLQAAALRDVLTTLARRAPQVAVIVYPVPVQGDGAGARIAAMLETVSQRAEVDVVLLVRGGGSIEDLWAFNDEAVARAIRASALPVVVGVGHESDFTIADFAADLRAPTPTAAAELATPERAVLLQGVVDRLGRLGRAARRRLQQVQQRLDYSQRALSSPRAPVSTLASRVQQLTLRAAHALARTVADRARQSTELRACLRRAQPAVASRQHRVLQAQSALAFATRRLWLQRQHHLQMLGARLQVLDPHSVLTRGYSIALDANGHAVTDAARLQRGDLLQLQFARGRAQARIEQVLPATDPDPPRSPQG
jgi:exodeoxyribonuclease VII large subunit